MSVKQRNVKHNAIVRATKGRTMPHIIRSDKHGPYIRCDGAVFRPLFPIDFPPHPNTTQFEVGQEVACSVKAGTPLAAVRIMGEGEVWFSHGRYVRPRGSFKASWECYKPEGFTWPPVGPLKEQAQ